MSLRYEYDVKIGNDTYKLRCDIKAVAAIQADTGLSIFAIARQAVSSDLNVETLTHIYKRCIEGAGGEVPSDLAQRLQDASLIVALERIIPVILGAMTGGKKPKKTKAGNDVPLVPSPTPN